MFIAMIIYFVIEYRKRRIAHNQEKEVIHQVHQEELLSTQLEIQTQTMQHIGREIHDNIGQKLTLASLYTQQLSYENRTHQINDKIETIGNIINETLGELRQLSKSLTDDHIDKNDIVELLQKECSKANDLQICNVLFIHQQYAIKLPYQKKVILIRIVQEFLQNSIKHAVCKNIQVSLHIEANILYLTLKDDGKGFDIISSNSNGIGLSNMKKRTQLIGGIFILESSTDNGTNLNIELPLSA